MTLARAMLILRVFIVGRPSKRNPLIGGLQWACQRASGPFPFRLLGETFY
tara:strand:+ start:209 stop:358 length:150 start_codon:yes stop_codon:yes gene_type:complete